MEPAVLGLILAAAAAGLIPAWLLARFVRAWLGWSLAGLLAAAAAAFIVLGRASQGWDGLSYVILALVFAAPAMFGAMLGTALGGWMRARGYDSAIGRSR